MTKNTSTAGILGDLSVAIVWGSGTGYTEEVADTLHRRLHHVVDSIFNIANTAFTDLMEFDVLIFGIPTWHVGELQDDWDQRFDEISGSDLRGKWVAFFGCGDACGYPDTFQDAMGILWQELEKTGATLLGRWPIEGYEFEDSRALTPDGRYFVGLAIDEHSQDKLTETRIERWARQLEEELECAVSVRDESQPPPNFAVLVA